VELLRDHEGEVDLNLSVAISPAVPAAFFANRADLAHFRVTGPAGYLNTLSVSAIIFAAVSTFAVIAAAVSISAIIATIAKPP
jgi:hypothetical protein